MGGFPFIAADGDIDDEFSVEVMLEVMAFGDDAGGIPFADGLGAAFARNGEEVVKSGGLAFGSFFTVGMFVVEDLVFWAEVAFSVFGDAVFDATVSFFGDLPLPAEFEITVFFCGVEVA